MILNCQSKADLEVIMPNCPSCGYENAFGAVFCNKCYAPLPDPNPTFTMTTLLQEGIPSFREPKIATSDPQRLDQIEEDNIAFYIDDNREPLIVQITRQTILGRSTSENAAKSYIDLTAYDALVKGVSRLHAVIRRSETGLFVEDLASSNGSWLNEVRLQPYIARPLKPGDRLRLSRIEIGIYFNERVKSAGK